MEMETQVWYFPTTIHGNILHGIDSLLSCISWPIDIMDTAELLQHSQ